MTGIPNSGVADKIREIDEQESHWKSDTMVVDTNLEDDTMASNHNSGAEEKIRDVRDQESNWMSDWRKSERIRKIERSLVIYGGQNGGQAEQNGGRAKQNGGQSEQNGGQDDLFLLENQVPMALLTKVMNKCSEILNDQKKRSLRKREIPDPFSPKQLLDSSLKAIAKQMCISVLIGPTNDKKKFEASIEAKFLEGELEKCGHIFSCADRILCTPTTSVVEQPVSKQPPQTVGRLFTNNCLRCSNSTARMQPNHILSVPQSLEPIRSLIIQKHQEHQDYIFKSATKLKKAGIRIEKCCGMLEKVAFENGCLCLPIVILEDRTESYFRNLTMYEMFDETDLLWRGGDRPFTNYIQLMGQLIKKKEDVEHLIDKGVIVNGLVTIENAFDMWNKLQKGLPNTPYSKRYQLI
ncbi:hypothetical protein BDL97_02G190500 [Sphagnum fallax]|nr:hypothetical protein BDL97_02G190500 [Sphagnum fallax]